MNRRLSLDKQGDFSYTIHTKIFVKKFVVCFHVCSCLDADILTGPVCKLSSCIIMIWYLCISIKNRLPCIWLARHRCAFSLWRMICLRMSNEKKNGLPCEHWSMQREKKTTTNIFTKIQIEREKVIEWKKGTETRLQKSVLVLMNMCECFTFFTCTQFCLTFRKKEVKSTANSCDHDTELHSKSSTTMIPRRI